MDEAMLKSGVWPNVAIEAGTDPHEAMKKYGVNEHTLRTACYDYEQRIRALEELVREMWHELNYTSVRAEDGENGCLKRMEEFDRRVFALGIGVD